MAQGAIMGQTLDAVSRTGDTMTGPLILSGPPTEINGAATKGYVDSIGAIAKSLTFTEGQVNLYNTQVFLLGNIIFIAGNAQTPINYATTIMTFSLPDGFTTMNSSCGYIAYYSNTNNAYIFRPGVSISSNIIRVFSQTNLSAHGGIGFTVFILLQ